MSKKPTFTDVMRKAGIKSIGEENYNGSFTCSVRLGNIDLDNTDANPRRYSKAHGGKLRRNWFRRAVRNPILVLFRGKLISIDGRHTIEELIDIHGEDFYMTCDVHFQITMRIAATIFYQLVTNCKRISPWDGHATALRAGFHWAVKIEDTLEFFGLTCPNDPGWNRRTCDVTSYDPLHEAWLAKNGLLERLLYIMSHVYAREGGMEKPAKSCDFMRGLIDILSSNEWKTVDIETIADLLVRRSAWEVTSIAHDYAAEAGVRENRGHFYLAFLDVLNMPANRRRAA